MKKTMYRCIGACIFVLDLLCFSLNIHLTNISNSIIMMSGYTTDTILNSMPLYSIIILFIVLIIAVYVGFFLPRNLDE